MWIVSISYPFYVFLIEWKRTLNFYLPLSWKTLEEKMQHVPFAKPSMVCSNQNTYAKGVCGQSVMTASAHLSTLWLRASSRGRNTKSVGAARMNSTSLTSTCSCIDYRFSKIVHLPSNGWRRVRGRSRTRRRRLASTIQMRSSWWVSCGRVSTSPWKSSSCWLPVIWTKNCCQTSCNEWLASPIDWYPTWASSSNKSCTWFWCCQPIATKKQLSS